MRTRRPLSINNSLVHGICNYSCTLCAVNKPQYCGPREMQDEATTRALVRRVQEAGREGIFVRYLSNAGDGEPTLHPDFAARLDLFGDMVRTWSAPVPPPEIAVVSNGARLHLPEVLRGLCQNAVTLIISLPTVHPAHYGEIVMGRPEAGPRLLRRVLDNVAQVMRLRAEGRIAKLAFHLSPPERDLVRQGFADTVDTLSRMAAEAGLDRLELVLFPATSNRGGLVRERGEAVDTYRDLRRAVGGKRVNGVRVALQLSHQRFYRSAWELLDVLRASAFPCLWNGSFFIAADGSSICCNDQAARCPQGSVHRQTLRELVEAKEDMSPARVCRGCDQDPTRMGGSLAPALFALAARARRAVHAAALAATRPIVVPGLRTLLPGRRTHHAQ